MNYFMPESMRFQLTVKNFKLIRMNQKINILVVDDNKLSLHSVSNYLKGQGYELTQAANGEEALQLIESTTIDLILLDIMMPGMDGFEVCARLKQDPATKDIPIIFLSAKIDTDDIITGFKAGGVDYITKPFNKEELLARIRNHVELKLMRDMLKSHNKQLTKSRNTFMKTLLELSKFVDSKR